MEHKKTLLQVLAHNINIDNLGYRNVLFRQMVGVFVGSILLFAEVINLRLCYEVPQWLSLGMMMLSEEER